VCDFLVFLLLENFIGIWDNIYLFICLYKDAGLSAHPCTVELQNRRIHSWQQ